MLAEQDHAYRGCEQTALQKHQQQKVFIVEPESAWLVESNVAKEQYQHYQALRGANNPEFLAHFFLPENKQGASL